MEERHQQNEDGNVETWGFLWGFHVINPTPETSPRRGFQDWVYSVQMSEELSDDFPNSSVEKGLTNSQVVRSEYLNVMIRREPPKK